MGLVPSSVGVALSESASAVLVFYLVNVSDLYGCASDPRPLGLGLTLPGYVCEIQIPKLPVCNPLRTVLSAYAGLQTEGQPWLVNSPAILKEVNTSERLRFLRPSPSLALPGLLLRLRRLQSFCLLPHALAVHVLR